MRIEQVAIAATFTAEPLADPLAFWGEKLNFARRIIFAPYGQLVQQLLDPSGIFSGGPDTANVLLVRTEDWMSRKNLGGESHDPSTVQRSAQDFISAVQAAKERATSPFLLCFCPASPKTTAHPGLAELLQQTEDCIIAQTRGLGGIHVVTATELAVTYPVDEYYDTDTDEMGHIPYTREFFAGLGTMIARKLYGMQCAPYKVIATDCDNVLWRGICGEAGPLGVEIDPACASLQQFLLEQHNSGILLCLCSKNDESDVFEVFQHRPEMPLKRAHIVASRINWRRKSENLRALAQELNLGLDSFAFLDDNPVECAEVQAECPEVLTIQLPQSDGMMPQFLKHIWTLDIRTPTQEDRQRPSFYKGNIDRERLRQKSLTLAEFLAGLDLKVHITAADPEEFARLAQLTERTNQFNCTTIRRSEDEIWQLSSCGQVECLSVRVHDRFGDYGLVGALMFRAEGASLQCDTFLLSCRVLGRGVEHHMLQHLLGLARSRGLARVEVPLIRSPRNQPALDFLEKVGVTYTQPTAQGFLFRFPASMTVRFPAEETGAASANWQENKTVLLAASGSDDALRADSQLVGEIATELCDAKQILKAIRARKARAVVGSRPTNGKPRTPVEQTIASVWGEVLAVDSVGIYDNFFDHLGGDSLLGTQVVSRLRHIFRLPLPLRTLFEAPTVAGLAVTIVESLASADAAGELAGMLAELEAPARVDETLR